MSDNFFFAERIRAEEKYFDMSLSEIERTLLHHGRLECDCEHYIDRGGIFEIRLNLYTKSPLPISWSASLKLHRKRIDGIDYETRFKTTDQGGEWASGWHRHEWDRIAQSADRRKASTDRFQLWAAERSRVRDSCSVGTTYSLQ